MQGPGRDNSFPIRSPSLWIAGPSGKFGNHEPRGFRGQGARPAGGYPGRRHRDLVTRDAFASFYHHPFLNIALLKQTVQGLKAQGYTFVSVQDVLADP